jgi:uncharacterized SAM-binding protein YcdF (DUF218 family)
VLLTVETFKFALICIVVVAFTILLGLLLCRMALSWLGEWLVVADPLQPACAIVVLGGSYPFRAMQAAETYHQGWAGEIWLTRYAQSEELRVLASLGVELPTEDVLNRLVLERLGVPAKAIMVIDRPCIDTESELRRAAEERPHDRGGTIILITSKSHTRRVKALWKSVAAASQPAIVRYAERDPFRPDRWFLSKRDAEAVAHEVFGLLNFWARFAIRGRRPQQPDSPRLV